MSQPDWAAVRDQFPALRHWTFLNTATFGQMPIAAVEAMNQHFAHRDELACADFLEWFDDADGIRGLVAKLIYAAPEDIAFIPNAANGLSLLLERLDWRAQDEVLTLAGEFPNQLYHPALLEKFGVVFRAVTWPEFESSITDRTKLVALSTVNYQTGFRPPLGLIGKQLRERGILLYLDGTQSLGALKCDVTELQPDMLAVHGYKWLLSPTGAGFLYVKPELRQRLSPTTVGWRSHHDWRNVENLHQGAPLFKESAEKYEAGMLPFPLLYGMAASIRLMLSLGIDVIEQRVLSLADQLRQVLREAGGQLPSDDAPHFDSPVVTARFPDRDAGALSRSLKEKRILVSARHGQLRVSTHFYNNEADLAALLAGLR